MCNQDQEHRSALALCILKAVVADLKDYERGAPKTKVSVDPRYFLRYGKRMLELRASSVWESRPYTAQVNRTITEKTERLRRSHV